MVLSIVMAYEKHTLLKVECWTLTPTLHLMFYLRIIVYWIGLKSPLFRHLSDTQMLHLKVTTNENV